MNHKLLKNQKQKIKKKIFNFKIHKINKINNNKKIKEILMKK